MARPRYENPNYRIVTLRCITDGSTQEYKDYGASYKNGTPSIEYSRILRALNSKSKIDGGRAFKVVDIRDPKLQGKTLDDRLAALGQKAPRFDAYEKHQIWDKEDDKRLAEHLKIREQNSAAAQAQGIAEQYRKKNQTEGAAETATAVVMALKEAGVIQASAPAAPAPSPRAEKTPKKDKA